MSSVIFKMSNDDSSIPPPLDYEDLWMDIIIAYSRMTVWVRSAWTHATKYILDTLPAPWEEYRQSWYRVSVVDSPNKWINVSELDNTNFTESYEYYTEMSDDTFLQKYNELNALSSTADRLIWMQDANRDIVRVHNPSSSKALPENVEFTSVEFLHVGYHHPQDAELVEFQLPKSLMVVGNELFSSAFIFRWLKHTHEMEFMFDVNYSLSILDNNIAQHVLKNGDYIELCEDDIKVHRRPAEALVPGETEALVGEALATEALATESLVPDVALGEEDEDCFIQIVKATGSEATI